MSRRPKRGETFCWLVTVWDERSYGSEGYRRAEFMFDTYATARTFIKEARKLLGFTPEDTAVRYPCAGLDLTRIAVYTSVHRAREQSWPFDELRP